VTRENTPGNIYVSSRDFCISHNVKKLQVRRDDKDNGKTFNKFANKFIEFATLCEVYGLEWPFEKIYWDYWRILKLMPGGDYLLKQYLERSKTEQFDWDMILEARFETVKICNEIN
jgi:hypothetical protein